VKGPLLASEVGLHAVVRATGSWTQYAQYAWQLQIKTLEEGVPLQRLARERGVPLRTAQRWLQRFQQHGLAGLAHRPRSD